MRLMNEFTKTIYDIGMDAFERPIFYGAPYGLRFEIGGEEDIYKKKGLFRKEITNPIYLQEAYQRARCLYDALPQRFSILRIDLQTTGKERQKEWALIQKTCGLPEPTESMAQKFMLEGDEASITSLFWDLNTVHLPIEQLLKQIIYADIGGNHLFSSSVYLLNTIDKCLYYLYDDRGLDIVAANQETIRPCYEQFSPWILSSDRTQIDQVFSK